MKKKLAFTLIEILIAISVFAIGILAVLRVLTGNLSVLDTANIKLQATVLAKEGIELLYNVRDSNLEKNLSGNCVLNPSVYERDSDMLNSHTFDSDNPEKTLCTGYYGIDKFLKLSFDKNYYLYQELLDKTESFDDLFKKTQLCLFSGEDNILWYAYCSNNSKGDETIFARYISFSPVYYGVSMNDVDNQLPLDKVLKVEVHVLYDKLGKTGDIVFESFIGNY